MQNNKINIILFQQKQFAVTILIAAALLNGCGLLKKANSEDKYKANVFNMSKVDSVVLVKKEPAKLHKLQIEFGKKLAVAPDSIYNLRLYGFIKEWLGIPYEWGGTNEKGIDCSAFVQKLYYQVYDIAIPRTSLEQYYTNWVDLYSNTKYLREGDLVFFKTLKNNNPVTHVGFYLHNNYFVNASSSKGVSIAKLNDSYWSVKYVACGRLKQKFYAKR